MTLLVLVDRDDNEIRRVNCQIDGQPKRIELQYDETIVPDLMGLTIVADCKFRSWRRGNLQTGEDELVYTVVEESLR